MVHCRKYISTFILRTTRFIEDMFKRAFHLSWGSRLSLLIWLSLRNVYNWQLQRIGVYRNLWAAREDLWIP